MQCCQRRPGRAPTRCRPLRDVVPLVHDECNVVNETRRGAMLSSGHMNPRGRTTGRAQPRPRTGLLTVGESARILGVSPSTLRLWENVGLISPVRSNGRYRLYSPELLDV